MALKLVQGKQVNIDLSKIASGSVSASISEQGGLQVNTNVTATSFTGSLFGTASYFLETDPIFTDKSGSLATTGSNIFKGNQIISGSIYLGSGSIISESGSSLVLTPPTAQLGQSLVIRPTSGNITLSASGYIVVSQTLTITLTSSQFSAASQEDFYYIITGATAEQLGLGSLSGTFIIANWVDTGGNTGYNQINIPIPANSSATTLTLTITGSSMFFGGYNFTNNPITVTNSGIISNEASHIHLVTGDPTTVDLYLGDDDQYVKIEKNAGNVVIGTNLDTNQWVFNTSGSLIAPGNITATSFTGSLLGTASYAEYALTASNILGGKAPHIPYFITDTTLATSSLYQSGSTSVIINQDDNTTANPEALYVWQPHPTSINVISGKGELDNYLQLNIQNTSIGSNASSDIVATANNGGEEDNYINMGINSQYFNGFLGGPNDSYLYSHGHDMWIGNTNDGYDLKFFNSSSHQPIITLTSEGQANITGSLYGTASWALNAVQANNATQAVSASHALQADNATTAGTANIALNGGVTNITPGTGITLLNNAGTGNVTIIAGAGTGEVLVISGSNVTGSFVSATSYTFNHNLGVRTPIIQVFDTNYNQVIPQSIELISTSSATITFPTNESGFAVASVGGVTGNAVSSSYSLFATYADSASYFPETDPIFVAKSGSLATTGSNRFIGSQTITGSLIVSSSNSITVIGPMTITGSLLVSGSTTQIGNNTLIGNTSLTGSITVSGSQTFVGNNILTGSFSVTGSTLQTGNNTLIGNTILSGSISVSGSQTFKGNLDLTGSFTVTGSTIQVGNNTLFGNTTLTGSIAMSGSILIFGDVLPQVSSSYSLGSLAQPWKGIYVQSGSINIQSDIPGGANAELINLGGDVSIQSAGFRVISGSYTPFRVDPTGRTRLIVPNIPANDIGAFSIIGNASGSYQPVINPSGMIHVTSNDAQAARVTVDGFGTTIGAIYVGRHARGTAALPTPTLSGDILVRFAGLGYATSSYFPVVGAVPTSLEFQATENYSTSSYGSRAAFYTYANGAVSRSLSATIDATGITIPSSSLLYGTASWALNALTASYVTSSNIVGTVLSSSYALTASYAGDYVLTSATSSMLAPYLPISSTSSMSVATASYVQNAQTASYILQAISSSYAQTASYAPNYTLNSTTSSMLAPYVLTSSTSSMSVATASYSLQAVSASYALTASHALNVQIIDTGSFATTGSNTFTGNQIVSGSLTLNSGSAFNLNDGFFVNGHKQFQYASFYHTASQTLTSATTPLPFQFSTIENNSGAFTVALSGSRRSRITTNTTGWWNIQYSAQTINGSSSTDHDLYTWLRINDTNVINSNNRRTIPPSSFDLLASRNNLLYLASGSYFEIMYGADSTQVSFPYTGTGTSPTRPATPSISLVITQHA